MITRRKDRTNRWITMAKFCSAATLMQFAGCGINDLPMASLADTQRALSEGIIRSVAGDVFSVAQTIFLNIFRV